MTKISYRLTLCSDFWAACGTSMGASSSEVSTIPRLPRVKIVERFFKDGLAEKNPKIKLFMHTFNVSRTILESR